MLPKSYRLRRRKDFKKIYKKGFSAPGRYVVLYALEDNNLETIRFGFSVSRKIGKAVQRNRSKRILREVCRRNINFFVAGFDVIIIARRKIKEASYREIEKDLITVARKLKLTFSGK